MTEPESVRLSGKKCPLCPPEHPRWIFSSPEIEVRLAGFVFLKIILTTPLTVIIIRINISGHEEQTTLQSLWG